MIKEKSKLVHCPFFTNPQKVWYRAGRLEEVLDLLGANGVDIVALSLADTSDYGMLRMIVNDPTKGKDVLKAAGITSMLTDVVAIRVPHAVGSLAKAMHKIVDAGINV